MFGSDAGVEGLGMVEVTVPDFIDGIMDELGSSVFGCFVGVIVALEDGMVHSQWACMMVDASWRRVSWYGEGISPGVGV